MNSSIKLYYFIAFIVLVLFNFIAFADENRKPCTDYPSCELISVQLFDNYCNRSTLKSMCPTHCDPKCKLSKITKIIDEAVEEATEDELNLSKDVTIILKETSSKKSTKSTPKTTTKTTTQSTTTEEKKTTSKENTTTAKASKQKPAKKMRTRKTRPPTTSSTTTSTTTPTTSSTTTTSTTTTTTTATTTTTTTPTTTTTTSTTTTSPTTTSTTTTTPTTTSSSLPPSPRTRAKVRPSRPTRTTTTTTTDDPEEHGSNTEEPFEQKTNKHDRFDKTRTSTKSTTDVVEATRPNLNLPNATIFVPLFEAQFVQRTIPTSSKDECDFTKATICKQKVCNWNGVWCPKTNDIPKEQIEILFNYTTDIYMLETQGRITTNETVTNFLFQHLNDAGVLVSQIFKTDTKNSTKINKFMFDPPLRTNYVRITPIEFEESIAMRFELYSKGILYTPGNED